MSSFKPIIFEIPLDRKVIAKNGRNPYKYVQDILLKIYKDNNLPQSKRINDKRHQRKLEFKEIKGDTVVYEIRYEHHAKVGNTIEPIKTPRDNGLAI